MIWRIPVNWKMTGTQEIDAETLVEAMSHACDDFNATDGEFVDNSLVLLNDDVESVRYMYNNGRPDGLEELQFYTPENKRQIYWYEHECGSEDAESREQRMIRGMGWYRIIFDIQKERYYCDVEALNIDEALGVFFAEHPHITYAMVVDHMEV